jgi:hypothetical protein
MFNEISPSLNLNSGECIVCRNLLRDAVNANEHEKIIKNSLQYKAVLLHSMVHLGGRKYSFYSFLTLALDGSDWSASLRGHALPLGKGPIG